MAFMRSRVRLPSGPPLFSSIPNTLLIFIRFPVIFIVGGERSRAGAPCPEVEMLRPGSPFARAHALIAGVFTLAFVLLLTSSPAGQGQRGQGAPPQTPATPAGTGRGGQQ